MYVLVWSSEVQVSLFVGNGDVLEHRHNTTQTTLLSLINRKNNIIYITIKDKTLNKHNTEHSKPTTGHTQRRTMSHESANVNNSLTCSPNSCDERNNTKNQIKWWTRHPNDYQRGALGPVRLFKTSSRLTQYLVYKKDFDGSYHLLCKWIGQFIVCKTISSVVFLAGNQALLCWLIFIAFLCVCPECCCLCL